MDSTIRHAIARVEVVSDDGGVLRRGTGCLVGQNLILTAFHVIGHRESTPPRLRDGTIHLTFPSHSTRATVIADAPDLRARLITADYGVGKPPPRGRCPTAPWATCRLPTRARPR